MSPQEKARVSPTKRLVLFILVCAVTGFLIKAIYHLVPVQSQRSRTTINGKPLADKEPLSERTTFTENGPPGSWSGSFVPDSSRDSSSSPVVVVGNSTLMGNAQLRNLQLTHVTLKNHSSKTVLGVQLKWFISTKAEPTKQLPPPGYTGLFEAKVLPGETKKVESPVIKFSRATKHLVKNGTLEGDFFVQVRVYQVEFEDGSSWNDDWGGPKPGERGEQWKGGTEPKPQQNHVALQTTCAHTLCSYNTPDSHAICEPYPAYQLTCVIGPPCTGQYCTCDHQECISPTPTPTPTPTPVPCPATLPDYCPGGVPADDCTWDNPPEIEDGCSPFQNRVGACCFPLRCPVGCMDGGNAIPADPCRYPYNEGCPDAHYRTGGCCYPYYVTPILIDVDGAGFHLTNASNGVWFDFFDNGKKIKISWTDPHSTNAFLVLDRNGNGQIDSGKELFGNLTAQPKTAEPNGFIALAEFDKPTSGGNLDGVIDRKDGIFASLRLWQDANHNGFSEQGELSTLDRVGLKTLELGYKASRRTDQFGNQFRYRAKVKDIRGEQLGRWAWDVFLVNSQ